MSHVKVKASEVKPNPFRHMDRYPVDKEKIDVLLGSMERTGFWDNVIARKKDGEIQLAYGHHRWLAFRRRFGKDAEMPLTIVDLSDEDMLRVMADENANEYGHTAAVEQETIRAVILAYAEGRVILPPPLKGVEAKQLRWAPLFTRGTTPPEPFNENKWFRGEQPPRHWPSYTDETVARFLQKNTKHGRWLTPGGPEKGPQVSPMVREALRALEAIEEGLVQEESIKGLTREQVRVVASGAKVIENRYRELAKHTGDDEYAQKGRQIASKTAEKMAERMSEKDGMEMSVREARVEMKAESDRAREELARQKGRALPTVEEFVSKLAKQIECLLSPKDDRWDKIAEIMKVRDKLGEGVKGDLIVALKRLIDRSQSLIDGIEGKPQKLSRR